MLSSNRKEIELRRERLRLKKRVLRYFRKIGYSAKNKAFNGIEKVSKDNIRLFHLQQKKEKLEKEKKLISELKDEMLNYLASGKEIIPEKIDPYLIPVTSGTKESEIFRFATLNWSVPVSMGYGRRMRFLVMDRNNEKLIGIFALGDPVYNLKVRDEWIGWNRKTKSRNLINVLDAFVLGALPPYSNLIGGKLVAALITSKEVQKEFKRKYGNSKSFIRKRNNKPRLVLLTTTSALGKSSLYDRLRLNGEDLFKKIGETQGYGHFHISEEIFNELRNYLVKINHPYATGNRYGQGSNWRIRVIRKALSEIGLSSELLSHGIKREVYIIPLASNAASYLCGKSKRAFINAKTVEEISELCKNRWIVPRSQRDKSYLTVNNEDTLKKMINLT